MRAGTQNPLDPSAACRTVRKNALERRAVVPGWLQGYSYDFTHMLASVCCFALAFRCPCALQTALLHCVSPSAALCLW